MKEALPVRNKVYLGVMIAAVAAAGFAEAKSYRVAGAIVHMRQKEFDQAIVLLEEEVAAAPDNAEAYGYLGDAYANVGKFAKAAEAWARAEDLYTQKNKTKDVKKIKQSRMFFWDKALKVGQEKLARALSFETEGFQPQPGETPEADLEAAAEAIVATYRVFPDHPKTLWFLGITYEEMARVYGEKDAEELVTVTDYDLEAGPGLQREVKAGEYAQELQRRALAAYEKALELKHADLAGAKLDQQPLTDYAMKAANLYLHLKEFEKALAMLDPLVAAAPDDLTLLSAKAAVLENLDRNDEAMAIYKDILNKTADVKAKAEICWRVGAFYMNKENKSRDPKEAIKYLEEGLKYAPEDYRLYGNLGAAYLELGEDAKARECLRKADELYKKQTGGK